MKISNSKKELARIISENGGWPERALWAVQDNCIAFFRNCIVFFRGGKPEYKSGDRCWYSNSIDGVCVGTITCDEKVTNWHQKILSREEYFHLYPAAEPAQEPAQEPASEVKPIIEQLAADYRNAKDYADRKQQEADAAKADAEAKLADLVTAGKALGLELSVAGVEPGLVITEIEDLLEGDVIELTAGGRYNKTECTMVHITSVGLRAKSADDTENQWWNLDGGQESEWRFIRRP